MRTYWPLIEDALQAVGLLDATKLNPGASPAALEALEKHIGIELPAEMKAFWMVHDGQPWEAPVGVYAGHMMLSVDQIKDDWDSWVQTEEDGMNEENEPYMSALPADAIKPVYANRRWLSLVSTGGGNFIGLDFDPGPSGRMGQVIIFGRDENMKKLVADSFEGFVAAMLSAIREGNWSKHDKHRDEEWRRRNPSKVST